jgi:hypothetical protein
MVLHQAGAPLALATHDPILREALLAALGPVPVEMLLGVRYEDARNLGAREQTRIQPPTTQIQTGMQHTKRVSLTVALR